MVVVSQQNGRFGDVQHVKHAPLNSHTDIMIVSRILGKKRRFPSHKLKKMSM